LHDFGALLAPEPFTMLESCTKAWKLCTMCELVCNTTPRSWDLINIFMESGPIHNMMHKLYHEVANGALLAHHLIFVPYSATNPYPDQNFHFAGCVSCTIGAPNSVGALRENNIQCTLSSNGALFSAPYRIITFVLCNKPLLQSISSFC
jgi:hypothetical protein